MTRDEVRELRRQGESIKDISRQYGICSKRVARWVEGVVVERAKPKRAAVPKGVYEAPERPRDAIRAGLGSVSP